MLSLKTGLCYSTNKRQKQRPWERSRCTVCGTAQVFTLKQMTDDWSKECIVKCEIQHSKWVWPDRESNQGLTLTQGPSWSLRTCTDGSMGVIRHAHDSQYVGVPSAERQLPIQVNIITICIEEYSMLTFHQFSWAFFHDSRKCSLPDGKHSLLHMPAPYGTLGTFIISCLSSSRFPHPFFFSFVFLPFFHPQGQDREDLLTLTKGP